jgi:hypothetical protein
MERRAAPQTPPESTIRNLLNDRSTAAATSGILADATGGRTGSPDRIEARIQAAVPLIPENIAKALEEQLRAPRQSMMQAGLQAAATPTPPKFSDSFKMFDGTAVGAERGFQNMAGAIASNEHVQNFGNWLSGKGFWAGAARFVLGAVSLPVELMGAVAKNIVTLANPNATMQEKLIASIPGIAVFQAISNASSGILDASQQKEMMFTQAGNYVADNKLFGATDAEGQARARLVGGALNLLGDPLLYAGGLGAARAGASSAARTALGTGRLVSGPIGDTAGILPRYLRPFTPPPGALAAAPVVRQLASTGTGATFGTKNINLDAVLKNIDSGNIGPAEIKLLDQLAASTYLDDLGRPLKGPSPTAMSDVAKALAGDVPAQQLLNKKVLALNNIIEKASENAKITGAFATGEELLNPRALLAIRSTNNPIERNAAGRIVLNPAGKYLDAASDGGARSTIHFTIQDLVDSHFWGDWPITNQKIVAPLKSMIDEAGLPAGMNPNDTWWSRSPGQGLQMPSNTRVITTFSDDLPYPRNQQGYLEELARRNLVPPGQTTPLFAVDSARQEILHLLKKTYSLEDRLQLPHYPNRIDDLMADLYGPQPPRPMDPKVMVDRSLDIAREILGTSGIAGGQSLTMRLNELAQKLGVKVGDHMRSPSQILEKGKPLSDITSVDSMDALRWNTLRVLLKNSDDLTSGLSVPPSTTTRLAPPDLSGRSLIPPGITTPRSSQSSNFVLGKFTERDIPPGVLYKEGRNVKRSSFIQDDLGESFFTKSHLATNFPRGEFPPLKPSFGYEFLAGRVGPSGGAHTPQSFILPPSQSGVIDTIATRVVPGGGSLPKNLLTEATNASSVRKGFEEMFEGFARYNENTPGLNAIFQNKDLHANNVLWDPTRKRFMQIDFEDAAPMATRLADGTIAQHSPILHAVRPTAEQSMVTLRSNLNAAINDAIDAGLLGYKDQMALAKAINSHGFTLPVDANATNPLRSRIYKLSAESDMSNIISKAMELDPNMFPGQLARELGISQMTANRLNIAGAAERIRDMAEFLSPSPLVRLKPGSSEPRRVDRPLGSGGVAPGFRMGGLIPYKAMGGLFKTVNTDSIPAMLTPGEFVVRRSAVENFGVDNLEKINDGTYNDGSVYNYNLSVNVKSESNPDQIARTVIDQIKRIDSQRIRGNRF